MLRAATPRALCHAHREGKTVTERSGGCLNAGQLHLARVHTVGAIELPVGVDDAVVREEPLDRHRDVHRDSGVTLAEDEPIAGRIGEVGGVDIKSVLEQHGEDVGRGQITADVHCSLVRTAQVQELLTKLESEILEFLDAPTLLRYRGRSTHHMPPHR